MRMRYRFIIFLLLPFYTLTAQEDPRFTLLPWLQPFFNPGAMGEKENHLNFIGVLRQHTFLMHDDIDENNSNINDQNGNNQKKPNGNNQKPKGTPTNGEQIFLNIDSYIKQIRGAVGVAFLKDKNGYLDNIGFRLGYAAKLRIRGGKLGIGIQFGFLNMKPPTVKLNPNEESDNTLNTLGQSGASVLDFDMNVGLHYKAPTWHAGVSCTRLLGGGKVRLSGEKNVFNDIPPQLYITGGYIWDLNTAMPWSIEPNVLIRTNFATWTLDVMAVARYNGILWFGLSYQHNWAIAALFGAVPFYNGTNNYLKGLELGFAYSFQTTKLAYRQNSSMGDFEILVRYGFNFYKEKVLTGYGSSRHLYKNQY